MYEQISFRSLVSEGGVDRCVGEAMTYGRKCRNPIAAHNVQAACDTIRSLRGAQDQATVQRLCTELAKLCLCVRWHRVTQDSGVAATWAREIWDERTRHARSAESTPASSAASTPAQSDRSAPNTTPRTSPPSAGENSGLSGSTLQSIESLQAQLLISQRANADLHRENADRNTLQAQLTVCRREQRQSRHRIQDLEAQVETLQGEAHERDDSNSILREQIVDLTRTLEVRDQELASERHELEELKETFELATDELDCEKEHSAILELEVESEKEKSADLIRRLETTRSDLAAEIARSHDLQTQLNHEKDLKVAAETERALLQRTNTQLDATNKEIRAEMTFHLQQDIKDSEIRATLSDYQARWTTYNTSWSRFQGTFSPSTTDHPTNKPTVSLTKPTSFLAPLKPSTRRNLQAQIPWSTPTGTISDVSVPTVQIFYLNNLPGLLGLATASRDLALKCLECEEERWRSLPWFLLRSDGVEKAVRVVRGVVQELVGDVRGEIAGWERGEGVVDPDVDGVAVAEFHVENVNRENAGREDADRESIQSMHGAAEQIRLPEGVLDAAC